MVGVLQSLGANKKQIRKIFAYNGMQLIFKGMMWGNGLALLVAFLQDHFKLIPLDPANYYMPFVPIEWNIKALVLINLLTFVVVYISLSIPLSVVSRIKPIAALKFD